MNNILRDGEFITLRGLRSGPQVIVLSGVHGDEYFGVCAMEKIVNDVMEGRINILCGSITFGVGNPRAVMQRVRYSERNLNRMFKDDDAYTKEDKQSYEYARATELKKYLLRSDALLDVHGSYVSESKPFVICEDNAIGIVKGLGIQTVVHGFDRVEPGGTDYFMNTQGKIGICVECGYLGDEESSRVFAEDIIVKFLATAGVLGESSPQEYPINISRVYYKHYALSDNFVLKKNFKDFEELHEGEVIGYDGGISITTTKKSFILFARNGKMKKDECFLLGESS